MLFLFISWSIFFRLFLKSWNTFRVSFILEVKYDYDLLEANL